MLADLQSCTQAYFSLPAQERAHLFYSTKVRVKLERNWFQICRFGFYLRPVVTQFGMQINETEKTFQPMTAMGEFLSESKQLVASRNIANLCKYVVGSLSE